MSAQQDFSARLIAWQKKHGRHDLPWQNTRDPYAIWVSEIIVYCNLYTIYANKALYRIDKGLQRVLGVHVKMECCLRQLRLVSSLVQLSLVLFPQRLVQPA